LRIPLVISSRPSNNFKGPVVYLQHGDWEIESDHRDSIIGLTQSLKGCTLEETLVNGSCIKGPTFVFVSISKLGTESSLTITARLQ